MYNDSIKAENKIINNEDLSRIFQMMGETLKKYQKISDMEEQQNRMLVSEYQNYTFKDEGSLFKATVDFYDNTDITFDKYDNFASVFYSRIDEIKRLDVHFTLRYTVITPEPIKSRKWYSQSISMYITENKMDISLNLNSDDPKLDELYNLIKNIVLNAPEKYDDIIRKRSKITNTVAFALGLIPAIIITTILLFVPVLNTIFLKGYVVYPIVSLFLAFVIGSMVASSKLDPYYETIVPKKKVSYSNGERREYDDIEDFTGTSDILIGKKIDNLKNRSLIQEEYDKYKKYIPIELIALLVISLIVIIIGLFM